MNNLNLGKIVYDGYNNFPQKGFLEFDELNHESVKAWNKGAMSLIIDIIKTSPLTSKECEVYLDKFARNILSLTREELKNLLLKPKELFFTSILDILTEKKLIKEMSDLKICIIAFLNPDNINLLLKRFLITKTFTELEEEDESLSTEITNLLNQKIVTPENVFDFLSRNSSKNDIAVFTLGIKRGE